MGKEIKIGQKKFKFKKDAIAHYRKILNSYEFNQSLNITDFQYLMDLMDYDYLCYVIENEEVIIDEVNDEEDIDEFREFLYSNTPSNELIIIDIKIAKVQFNTKCFELFYKDGSREYISYLMMINNVTNTPEKLFYIACRNSIYIDIKAVKQEYFDKNSVKGMVKCQETSKLSKWTELVVDHRQPNTFSIIVDRFKEVNNIEVNDFEFTKDEKNNIIFQEGNWAEKFRDYHSKKATLRIVRTENNSSRTGMARIKRTSKDLTIK